MVSKKTDFDDFDGISSRFMFRGFPPAFDALTPVQKRKHARLVRTLFTVPHTETHARARILRVPKEFKTSNFLVCRDLAVAGVHYIVVQHVASPRLRVRRDGEPAVLDGLHASQCKDKHSPIRRRPRHRVQTVLACSTPPSDRMPHAYSIPCGACR